jgi:hypothetical protein
MELALEGRYSAVEVHIIFSKGASLIKAAKLDHTSSDNFVLGDAKY